MSTAPDPPWSYVVPRPGVLKTLGICHIVLAVVAGFFISSSLIFTAVGSSFQSPTAEVRIEVPPTTTSAPPAGVPMSSAFNPFMGFQEKAFVRFNYLDGGIGLVMNLLMFITGLGLINRKRWAVRGWVVAAWVRIVLVCLIWGYYIVAVAPGFSEAMAKEVLKMYASQGVAVAKLPPVSFFTRVYSVMNLIIAFGAMLVTSFYPALSIWFLSQPGVKAAIVDPPLLEVEQL